MNDAQNSSGTAKPIGRPFPPGKSGNPGGRPAVPEFARSRTDDAYRKMIAIMDGEDEDDRVSPGQAAMWLVDRVHGKAVQALSDDEGTVTAAAAALYALAQAAMASKGGE